MKNVVHKENVYLLLHGFSDWQSARMSRCLAIQMCEESSSEQSGVSQQHIPWDQVTADLIPNRKSVLHYCQLCNIFPILLSLNWSKMFCNSLDALQTSGAKLTSWGLPLCLTWFSWRQNFHQHYFRLILPNYVIPLKSEGNFWSEMGSYGWLYVNCGSWVYLFYFIFLLSRPHYWEDLNAQFGLSLTAVCNKK